MPGHRDRMTQFPPQSKDNPAETDIREHREKEKLRVAEAELERKRQKPEEPVQPE